MLDDYSATTNGRKDVDGDDSTVQDEEDGVMRAGYTNNYGYGATEVMAPTDSENERGGTPNRYPKEVSRSPNFSVSFYYLLSFSLIPNFPPPPQVVPQRVLREERRSPSEPEFPLRRGHHSPHSESGESDQAERTTEQQIRFERQQRNFMMDLLNKSAKVVQVTYPRTANNEKELSVSRGEYLEVIDDTRKWWRARNLEGQVGHVPHTIVTPAQGLTDSPQLSPKSADWVQQERRGKKGEFRYF
jgi:hypothetical protein